MKKVVFTIIMVLVFAFGANAQVPTVPSPFSFYGGGAVSIPASPDGFDATYKTGWHGMAGVGYKIAPKFQVIGKLEYHNFGTDLDALALSGGNEKYAMFGADTKFTPNLPSIPFSPFVFGGVGMAHIAFDDFTSDTDPLSASVMNAAIPDAQNKLYWNFGAGFDVKAGKVWSLFVQGRYVSVATEGESTTFIPFTVGLKFF
ncbi:MAG: outer membrane beta-barrel protein [candidate division Zixibacteria bacterium]|nr:outer membrane beta-barrel protein [candidate division Zixibacteria bacterium]